MVVLAPPSRLVTDEEPRLEMDSLDFLSFVEVLSGRTGLALPEQDYPALTTLNGCAEYVSARTTGPQGDAP
ncbi:acyl carrier protein [Streptomyces sp. NPDC086023]|uniref:acyl carrier protein n=1 Tax=Streptomyces sp. NPDC086023 TaxID=3365746 RepID=UPI0037D88206